MCGILFYKTKGTIRDDIKELCNTLKHRGPDNTKIVCINEKVVLGFHRLSINGTTDQPISINNMHLICNGEIYNYIILANEHDITLTTNSDCEIILHLYVKYGIDKTIQLLNSESAFVIYDENTDMVICSRDHLGIRPMFMGQSENELFITSELKAIPNDISACQLPPGYGINDIYYSTKTCYNICYDEKDYETVYSKINNLLTTAVSDRLMSDRKIGAFLSGGLDSSIIVSILSRFTDNIDVFTIGLDGSPDIDAAVEVCNFLNLKNHHIVKYTVDEGISYLSDVIKSIESYDITTVRASIPQWILSKYIKENTNTTVLFSGECIDEMLGYYYLKFLNDDEFISETHRMLDELYLYDLLRTDRTTAAHSLEVRVPFADKKIIDYIMSLPLEYRKFNDNIIEKHLIRKSFNGYLPDSILWRKKHAFSDSVSGNGISWYKSIQEHANKLITESEYNNRYILYPHNTPNSYESFLYRKIFETHYPGRASVIPKFWMPKINGKNITDPSATTLDGFSI